jgi:hypothetical protein
MKTIPEKSMREKKCKQKKIRGNGRMMGLVMNLKCKARFSNLGLLKLP